MSGPDNEFRRMEAILALIRYAENGGTERLDSYTRVYGGGHFTGWKDHPRQSVTRWHHISTAAGAYQITKDVYSDAVQRHVAHDFSPRSQDAIAEWLIKRANAEDAIYAGDRDEAFRLLIGTWPSLPGGSQQEINAEQAKAYFWNQLGKSPP